MLKVSGSGLLPTHCGLEWSVSHPCGLIYMLPSARCLLCVAQVLKELGAMETGIYNYASIFKDHVWEIWESLPENEYREAIRPNHPMCLKEVEKKVKLGGSR